MDDENRKSATNFREYFRNAREAFEIFNWLWREMTTPLSKKKLYAMFASLILVVIFQSVQPMTVSFILNGLIEHDKTKVLWFGLGAFFVCLVVQKLVDRYQQRCREWILGLHWVRLDDRITELFFGKSVGQHIHEGTTLSVSNIDKGRWRALELQGMLLFDAIPTIIQLLFACICLCILDLVSGMIMVFVVCIYVSWSLYLNFRVNQVCVPIDKDFRALNRRRVERWERVERVKVSGKESVETSEMSQVFGDIMHRDRTFWLWFIDQACVRSIVNVIGLVAVMGWGTWLVWKGAWQIGLLYPLYAWSGKVSENIWQLGDIEHKINWNIPAVKSMIEALKIPPMITDNPDAAVLDAATPHCIEFRDISHVYPTDAKSSAPSPAAILKISFTINPGEKVALLGMSGAGKTTVMRKLLRFDDPTSGGIFIDGINLKDISQTSWRNGIGYIPQQSQVFDGTIRYNLMYSLDEEEKSKITDEHLWNLMRLLQIDFEERLTNGLDTIVGKNGIKLSGGQAQRLMIGAAVMRRPWLLIIDEATSSLDSSTEKKVQAGLSQILSDARTSALIVAHRLSTVRDVCTKFVVLKASGKVADGESQVEAIGNSFDKLYKISPTFRQLADAQGVKI